MIDLTPIKRVNDRPERSATVDAVEFNLVPENRVEVMSYLSNMTDRTLLYREGGYGQIVLKLKNDVRYSSVHLSPDEAETVASRLLVYAEYIRNIPQ